MDSVLVLVFVLAMLSAVIFSLAVAVAAFRQSIAWGLIYILIPGGNIAFLFQHWSKAKKGFFGFLASGGIAVIAFITLPENSQDRISQMLDQISSDSDDVSDLTAQIKHKRDRIFELETSFANEGPILVKRFGELEARRKALQVSDTVAVNQFNEEAAEYQQQNVKRKILLQELETERQELSELLAKRSTITTESSGGKSGGNSQQIVMYTTARCPACKAAKQYMAKRGITYDEKDVEAVAANYAEFKRLGGNGVPLILVGDKRMEGFNARALEEML